jgi:hypothetical protein
MACVYCSSPDIVLIGDALYDCNSCGGMFIDYDLVPRYGMQDCQHKFVNTGCARSWCKYCDVDGVYNFELGEYTTHENDARVLSRNTKEEPS